MELKGLTRDKLIDAYVALEICYRCTAESLKYQFEVDWENLCVRSDESGEGMFCFCFGCLEKIPDERVFVELIFKETS